MSFANGFSWNLHGRPRGLHPCPFGRGSTIEDILTFVRRAPRVGFVGHDKAGAHGGPIHDRYEALRSFWRKERITLP